MRVLQLKMKYLYLIVTILTSTVYASDFYSSDVYAKTEKRKLTLAVYLPQVPPYIYIDEHSGQLVGIVTDILKSYSEQTNLEFDYVYLNRLRAENALYDSTADVSMLSPQWLKHPEKLIFSDPLYYNGDRFYSLTPISNSPSDIKNLEGKVICTRRYFKYPLFDKYVAEDKVERMDTDSEVTQFRMMLSNRCDFAYVNEWVADYLINNMFDFKVIYSSEGRLDVNHGVLAFSKMWQSELPQFNRFISELKSSGKLANLVKHYTK